MRVELEYLQTNQYVQLPLYVNFHSHSKYELMYYYCGEGSVNSGGSLLTYTPGSVILIPPGAMHDEIHHSATDVTFIHFSVDDDLQLTQPCIYNGLGAKVEGMVRDMCTEWAFDAPYHREKQNAILLLLIVELLRAHSVNKIGNTSERPIGIHLKESIIGADAVSDQSIADTGYSYDRYRHVFKEKTGVAPHQFIIHTRIEKAKYLLTYTNLSITQIAMLSGYSSSSYFTMQFKKHVGVTPSAYRETK